MKMNPICKTDINSLACQTWMNEVCAHCRDLFAKEESNVWSAWWHDETPAFYKEVPEMTVYDCKKLKRLLELEVAALHPTELIEYESESFDFEWWHKILLISVYIGIMLIGVVIYRCWKHKRQNEDQPEDAEKDETGHSKSAKSEQSGEKVPHKPKKKKFNLRLFMRDQFRPIFIHNEAALRQQQAKYKEKELLREEYTQHNVEKWTKAREKEEKKRRAKKLNGKQGEFELVELERESEN